MIKRPEQRVAVFIDTQNMYHSAKHLYGARLHFGKLVEELVAGRDLVRAFAYVARSKTGEEKAFLEALQAAGIELRIKDVIEFSSGERKADWDVGMTVDAIKFSERVDTIILVTGDGDFCPLVEYLKAKGIVVEVAAFAESTSHSLREVTDEYFDISQHKSLLIKPGLFRGFGMKKIADTTDEGYDVPAHGEPMSEGREKEESEDLVLDDIPAKPARGSATKRRTVRVTT
jgi:uncharacterized LabA/DUF88 family protein